MKSVEVDGRACMRRRIDGVGKMAATKLSVILHIREALTWNAKVFNNTVLFLCRSTILLLVKASVIDAAAI